MAIGKMDGCAHYACMSAFGASDTDTDIPWLETRR